MCCGLRLLPVRKALGLASVVKRDADTLLISLSAAPLQTLERDRNELKCPGSSTLSSTRVKYRSSASDEGFKAADPEK